VTVSVSILEMVPWPLLAAHRKPLSGMPMPPPQGSMSGIITTPVDEPEDEPVLASVVVSATVVPEELPTLSVATGLVVDELPSVVVDVASVVGVPVVGALVPVMVPLPASSVGSATVADSPLVLDEELVPGAVEPVLLSLADTDVLPSPPQPTIKPRTLTRDTTECFMVIAPNRGYPPDRQASSNEVDDRNGIGRENEVGGHRPGARW
jgi:hypothetical protein